MKFNKIAVFIALALLMLLLLASATVALAKSYDSGDIIDETGDETTTQTVDVTYLGFVDSDHNVSGEIKITIDDNTEAVITSVSNALGDMNIAVDCGDANVSNYHLGVGEMLTCHYSKDLNGKSDGTNTATVTTEAGGNYSGNADLVWSDPDPDVNAIVNVVDSSDLFGVVNVGTLNAYDYAPNDVETFTYTKDFAWEDYGQEGCDDYTYNNTARIISGDRILDSDDATLKVNVQCLIYETAYAMGSGEGIVATCFIDLGFSQWGWTNLIGPGKYTWGLVGRRRIV